jgi:hypothetical protein
MVTTYASVADFFRWGMPQTAMGSRTVADVQSALDAASAVLDDYFRGRWRLPFLAVGTSVALHTVAVAVNIFLGGRGFSPVTGADQKVIDDLKAAEVWADKVQRRVLFPDVTLASNPYELEQPTVISFSVINANGQTAPNRGW